VIYEKIFQPFKSGKRGQKGDGRKIGNLPRHIVLAEKNPHK